MSSKVQAVARVQITVEFAVGGQVWNAETFVEHLHKQASDAALNILRRGLIVNGLANVGSELSAKTHADVIGDPKITAILMETQS